MKWFRHNDKANVTIGCKIPHFPVEQGTCMEGWLREIPPHSQYKRYSHNCRNCGASEVKNDSCAYCNTKY